MFVTGTEIAFHAINQALVANEQTEKETAMDYSAPSTLTELEIISSVGELSLSDAGHSHNHFCSPIAVGDSDSDSTPVFQEIA